MAFSSSPLPKLQGSASKTNDRGELLAAPLPQLREATFPAHPVTGLFLVPRFPGSILRVYGAGLSSGETLPCKRHPQSQGLGAGPCPALPLPRCLCHCPCPQPWLSWAGLWSRAGADTRGCPQASQNNAINAIWCRDTAFGSR